LITIGGIIIGLLIIPRIEKPFFQKFYNVNIDVYKTNKFAASIQKPEIVKVD